jgi:flagellar hook assembly protein FlgD
MLTLKSGIKNRKSKIFLCSVLCALCSLPLSEVIASEILDVEVLWDVGDEPLNIGDLMHFKVTTDGPGSVIVDISTVHQSIQLYDDGSNGDTIAGDHVYELDYSIFEGDTVEEGPVIARFAAHDGTEKQTKPEDDITPRITIDGTRPVITNDGVSPDPFNPNVQVAYIRYILTENASASISIYGGQELLRTLGTPSGKPGENHTTWDGADDEGNMLADGVYTYEIVAKDRAGNDAIPTRGGCILSTVYIEIDNSLIAPNPFSPDGDNVDDVAWITFDIKLIASEEQLAVLGFGPESLMTASTEDDGVISPFGIIGITIFDSSGGSKGIFPHDLSSDADSDFAPNGWPNGKMPVDVPLGSGNFIGMPNGLSDFADEDKGNDWDTLVPLHGPFESDEGSYYLSTFSIGWEAKDTPDGTYLISIECELAGRTWEFVEYMKSETGMIFGEKWHAAPARHHGIAAFPKRKSVIIDRKEIVSVDDDPPIVASTTPSSGSAIDPTRESVKEIIAVLDDGAGGSGVDPIESSISLLDPLGNKLGGQHVPFGINSIKLVLESELTVSGEYTIVVTPVDKRGNKAAGLTVKKFTVEDTSAPTVVLNTVQPRPTDFDSEGNPIDPYTQPVDEVSVVLTDGLTGSGVDLENSSIYLRDSEDETIEGTMSIDQDNLKLIYTLEKPLAASDTYIIVVIAADYAGAKGIYTYQLVLDMAENIAIRYGGKTYLMIYTATVGKPSSPRGEEEVDLSTITVEETADFPAVVSELAPCTGEHEVRPYAVRFEPYDIELSQEADLTLFYNEELLPLGIGESELSIYAFKSQAKDWVQLPNVGLSEEDNELKASVNYIDQYYIVAYASPIAPSLVTEVLLDPPKYFDPDRELLTFTFANNMTDYQVEIYNVAGDRIVTLKEQGRSDKSLGWDGRNENNETVRNGIFICNISYSVDGRSRSLNRLIAVIK